MGRWLIVLALALSTAAAAHTRPWTLPEARAPEISSDDLALARATLRDALDEAADGIVHFWTNARTRSSGTIIPIRWFQRDGMDCRDVEVSFQSASENTRSVWMLCQADEGWRSLGSR